MARAKERGQQRDLAYERVMVLFAQADALASEGDVESASRRVRRAVDISTRCNVRLPPDLKLRFCRGCLTYYTSLTSRRRLDSENRRLRITCLKCGRTKNRPYIKKKKG
jgi:RNase P subunit RPR2